MTAMARFDGSDPEHFFVGAGGFVHVRPSLLDPPKPATESTETIDPDALDELVEERHPTIAVHLSTTSFETTVEVHRAAQPPGPSRD